LVFGVDKPKLKLDAQASTI